MAYMLAQAEADVASACVVLHLKICHLSQMGFYNVLKENVMFSVWGPHGDNYKRYLFGAQECWNENVLSNNTQYSQQIPDLRNILVYIWKVYALALNNKEKRRLNRSEKVKGGYQGGGGIRHELFLRELSHQLKENKYFSIINQSDLLE